jgi:hypothetical protein
MNFIFFAFTNKFKNFIFLFIYNFNTISYSQVIKPETQQKKSKAQQKSAEQRAADKVARQAVCKTQST